MNGCGCIVWPIAYFLATVFLMMLTGLPATPALIITALLVVAGGVLRLKLGLYSSNAPPAKRKQPTTHLNFRDIQANRRIARGQHGMFDHNRQNRMAYRVWQNRRKK